MYFQSILVNGILLVWEGKAVRSQLKARARVSRGWQLRDQPCQLQVAEAISLENVAAVLTPRRVGFARL